jgi:hypothetical protein
MASRRSWVRIPSAPPTLFVLFNPIAKTSLTERVRARRSSSKMASGPSRSFMPPSRCAVASRSASRWQKRTKKKRARLQSSIQTSLKTWKKLSSTASLGTRQRGNSPRSFRDSTLNDWTISEAPLRSRRRQGAGSLTRLPMVVLDCDFAAGVAIL